MADQEKIVVLVHGWSVQNTDTYGQLPARLEAEAKAEGGPKLDFRNIWLGKYVSFRDEVKLEDISRAFEAAVQRELGSLIKQGRRFICITHSTGGPVVRDWWDRFYVKKGRPGKCPMSHLIMLAPANFGSALAQLGKGRLSRIKSWADNVEPGEGVLDWLELGSPESWQLNMDWLDYAVTTSGQNPVFPFVLTGQSIDRSLFDHVNSYTGEIGSDGVVRAASANLNTQYVKLVQAKPQLIKDGERPAYEAPKLRLSNKDEKVSQRTAFRLVEGVAHSGEEMGILRSIKKSRKTHPTVSAILDCISVSNGTEYRKLCDAFDAETLQVQKDELVEKENRFLLPDHYFIHDPHSMVIFRVMDDRGYIVKDLDLLLTAGPENSPNHLPEGFFRDRQANKRHAGTLTFFLNHALLTGCDVIYNGDGDMLRKQKVGAKSLGFNILPHIADADARATHLVHYLETGLKATAGQLQKFLKPNQTTMVDIVLKRVVRESVFRLSKNRTHVDFHDDPAGPAI